MDHEVATAEEEASFNLTYSDSNVLVYGIPQAQVLTNTTLFEGFPTEIERKIESLKLPTNIERSMHQAVLVSHLLDAEQAKSPYQSEAVFAHKNLFKHRYPKEYGISDQRKKYVLEFRETILKIFYF